MNTPRRFDLSLFAIAALLFVQASLASYGIQLIRTAATLGHQRIAVVIDAER